MTPVTTSGTTIMLIVLGSVAVVALVCGLGSWLIDRQPDPGTRAFKPRHERPLSPADAETLSFMRAAGNDVLADYARDTGWLSLPDVPRPGQDAQRGLSRGWITGPGRFTSLMSRARGVLASLLARLRRDGNLDELPGKRSVPVPPRTTYEYGDRCSDPPEVCCTDAGCPVHADEWHPLDDGWDTLPPIADVPRPERSDMLADSEESVSLGPGHPRLDALDQLIEAARQHTSADPALLPMIQAALGYASTACWEDQAWATVRRNLAGAGAR